MYHLEYICGYKDQISVRGHFTRVIAHWCIAQMTPLVRKILIRPSQYGQSMLSTVHPARVILEQVARASFLWRESEGSFLTPLSWLIRRKSELVGLVGFRYRELCTNRILPRLDL